MEGRDEKGMFVEGNKLSVGNKGGADNSKYKPEYCEKIIEYFNTPPQQVVYQKKYYADGALKEEYPIVLPAKYPTFELFANDICGVHYATIAEWKEKYSEFGEAYMRAKSIQKGIMITNAMQGLYNPAFAKFEAVNNHGMKDKQEMDLGNKDDKPFTTRLENLTVDQIKELLQNGN